MDDVSPFVLPELPWAINALEPVISQRTVEFHYGKHHAGYLGKLNTLAPAAGMDKISLEDIVRRTAGNADQRALFNNAAQVWNHTAYWASLTPTSSSPSGALGAALDRDFGSLKAFNDAFVDAAMNQFGSGWAWLTVSADGTLKIETTSNADTPMAEGRACLLTVDVWEHAYYLDHQNNRKQYLQAVVDGFLNWDRAETLFETASEKAA